MHTKEPNDSQTTHDDVIVMKVMPCRRMVSLLNKNYDFFSQFKEGNSFVGTNKSQLNKNNLDFKLCTFDDGQSYRQFVKRFYCITQANQAFFGKYRCLACNLKFKLKSCLKFHLTHSFNVVALECAHANCNNLNSSKHLKFPNHCALILHLLSHQITSTFNDLYGNVKRVYILKRQDVQLAQSMEPSEPSLFQDIAEFLDCRLDNEFNDVGLMPLPLRAVENLIKVLPDQSDVRELLRKKRAKYTCPECEEEIYNGVGLHIASEKSDCLNLKYPCLICGLPLASACALKAHSRLHTATPPFVCPECGLQFPLNGQNFENHVYHGPCQHGSFRLLFKCPVCPDLTRRYDPINASNKNGYLTMDEFHYHMIGEHPNILFLNDHSTKIMNLRKIVCCFCRFGPGPPPGPSDTFDSGNAYVAHLVCSFSCPRSMPFKLSWYQCSLCKFEHINKAPLTNHVRTMHSLRQSPLKSQHHSCHFCLLRFSNINFLNHHLTYCHSNELLNQIPQPIALSPSKSLNKDISPKTISYDDVLGLQVRSKEKLTNVSKKRDARKLHLLASVKNAVRVKNKQLSSAPPLTLTTQKKKDTVNVEYRARQYHKCEICNVFLPKRLSLVLHGAQHLLDANRTYAACCLTCNNLPFDDEEKFQSHLTREHDNKIVCEHCALCFETLSDYVLHLKELLERQKEICSHCGQAFNHARILKRHIEMYHKKARWVCYRCWVCYERCFSKISSLLHHLHVIHKLPRSQLDMRLVHAHKYSNFITSPLKQPSDNLSSKENMPHRWACKICGSFFASKITLNRHVCLKANVISGDILSANTNSFHHIKSNTESQSVNDQAFSIRCQVCASIFSTEEELKRHGRLHGMAFLIAHRNP